MRKLLNLRPILFIALSLCSGIAVTYFFMGKMVFWGVFLLSLFVIFNLVFLFIYTDKKDKHIFKKHLVLSGIFVLTFILGFTGFFTRVTTFENSNLNGHTYNIEGKIKSVAPLDEGAKLVLTHIDVKGKNSGRLSYDANVYVTGDFNGDIGDIVSFTATIRDNSYIYEDRFNGDAVEKRIKYTIRTNSEDILIKGKSLNIFERVNLFIRDSLSSGLDEEEFTVAYALLTGNSKFMDSEVLSSYRMAGVAHIFAVSGLHIGFLATAVYYAFRKLKVRALYKTIITTIILFFYSGVCGFSSSSIRATIMCLVSLIAVENGERYDSLSSISLSLIIILLISPVQLFCVGFQLSFVVVTGINLLSDPIKRLIKLPEKISKPFAVVLSAQLSSVPICLFAFKQFSLISIIANIIFIPFVSVLFIMLLLLTITGGIFNISFYTLFLPKYVLKFVNMCIQAFDYKIFIVSGITMGTGALSYYFAGIVSSGIINVKKSVKCSLTVMLSAICIITTSIFTVVDFYTPRLYVTNTDSICACMISDKNLNSLIVSDVSYIYSDYNLVRLANKTGVEKIDKLVFMNGYHVDMQVFLTKFITIFDVNEVYYFGRENTMQKEVISRSFPQIKLHNVMDNQTFTISGNEFNYINNGKVLTGEIKGKKTGIFSSERQGNIYYTNINKDFDIVVAMDNWDNVLDYYKAPLSISYRYSEKYLHAEGRGNLMVKIK